MRTVLIHNTAMDACNAPSELVPDRERESAATPDTLPVNLSTLAPGSRAKVIKVGASSGELSALERRLLELGFISGEHIEVLAETRPGRDPFVVRVGHTTLALRRGEAQPVWVEMVTMELSPAP
jgi:Fe2+ transport system protein FeoA